MNISGLRSYWSFLSRHKVYTFVSVVGFAISLTFVILLSLYAKTQLTMDSFHEKSDRIYLLTSDRVTDTYNPMGDYFMALAPEIESYVRIYEDERPIGADNGERYTGIVMIADAGFFELFTFQFIAGNTDTALRNRNSAVISEQTAMRLFGTSDALDRIVSVDGSDYSVSGVMKKFPYNTHFEEPDVIINYHNLDKIYGGDEIFSDYDYAHFTIYFLERENSDLLSKTTILQERLQNDFEDYDQMYGQMAFIPVRDIYFSDIRTDLYIKKGSHSTTRVYIGIVLLILAIALLNYINMTVAQSGFRAREAAVKKLLGSGRAAIVKQVIAESFIMTFAAFAIALFLAFLLEGYAEKMLDVRLDLWGGFTPGTVAFTMGALLTLTVMAGIIPAMILSSFSPLEVLKGTFKRKVKTGYSRALIIFQFAVCCGLLICTFVMHNQTSYMSTRDLGFNKDDILILQYPGLQPRQLEAARERIMQIPGVEAVGIRARRPDSWGGEQLL